MRTLIDELLDEQKSLSAVERFAQRHSEHKIPANQRFYRDLIPQARPGVGQQYAFAVDLDACTGCKACVPACHNLNGLDEEETWRNVGVLFGGTVIEPVQQTVTTACHHCVDPACMSGCPVLAYDKDPETGIVRHLDDQCIGCQYCILKCPYDVPKYSKKRGIVRKCDMCTNRLAVGEAPACVQACPNEAIRIEIVETKVVVDEAQNKRFLPEAPDPRYTRPTTRYHSQRSLPGNLLAADAHRLVPEHGHPPLVWMLVLTQLAAGAFCFQTVPGFAGRTQASIATVALIAGIVASTMHLGRPLYAWRAVLGLRRSWLSREIVAFGLFAKVALAYTALFWIPLVPKINDFLSPYLSAHPIQTALGIATALSGLVAVFCSVKIYEDTRRDFWRLSVTGGKFFGTALLLGASLVGLAVGSKGLCLTAAAALLTKLACEASIFRHLAGQEWTVRKQTALLCAGPLRKFTVARFGAAAVAMVLLVIAGFFAPASILAAVAIVICFGAELLERHLFFTAVVPPKMPGGIVA